MLRRKQHQRDQQHPVSDTSTVNTELYDDLPVVRRPGKNQSVLLEKDAFDARSNNMYKANTETSNDALGNDDESPTDDEYFDPVCIENNNHYVNVYHLSLTFFFIS
jgi:hypothetical protein